METPLSQYRARPPALATLILDDAIVRITQWDFEPGADTGVQYGRQYRHPARNPTG